jgi:phosphatidate cytidylyltransferase
MLKQRLLTALVLIPLAVWAILQLPLAYFALLLGLVAALGGWEWGRLMQLRSLPARLLFPVILVLALGGGWWLLGRAPTEWLAVPVIALFWWVLALAWVITYPRTQAQWAPRWRQFVVGLLILAPVWLALVGLQAHHPMGPYLVLYLLSLIWVADSGAYFGGRAWGRHKLTAAVSPGKTWEGVASALLASAAYALAAAALFRLPGNQWLPFAVLSLVTVAFSIVGDLAESMFKRHAGLKDSGGLLPGHGGVLDRIDSLTAAAPVFVVGLWLDGFDFSGAAGA